MNNLLQQAAFYHQNKNYIEAKKLYKYLLKMDSRNFDALMLLGFLHAELDEAEEAIHFLLQATKINDQSEPLCFNLAVAYMSQGRYQNAERFFRRTLVINPNNLKSIQELVAIESRKNNLDASVVYYEKAMQLSPGDGDIYNDFALIKKRQKDYSAAIELLSKALELNPRNSNALNNLGNLYIEIRDLDKAKKLFNAALDIDPEAVSSYIGLGNISEMRDLCIEAIDFYDKSLSLNRKSIVALTNKANILLRLRRYQDALAVFNEAYSLDPDFKNLCGARVGAHLQLCEWTSLPKQIDELQQKISNGQAVADPFVELTIADSPRLQKKAAEIYFNDQFSAIGVLARRQTRSSKKIKVAYLSADFRSHPVSFLTAELFELHTNEKFEFIGISFSTVKDEWHKRISSAFDQFIDASQMSDQEVLNLLNQSKIDIAIDLGGYTQKSRFSLFAKRIARVQMSYLGYLGTTGSNCIDYIIADSEVIPKESQKFYTEKIAYLPSYQVNDSHRISSNVDFTKTSFGIPEDAFVYCCFNNNYKILPEVFSSWMRILTKVEKSVLFLYVENIVAQENLKKEAVARGVDPARLIFGERLTVSDYLARYKLVDLFLDTFPYNAGTTASDALWAGVPVLTRQGEAFASRIASSLLRAIDLQELITKTISEYELLACNLGTDLGKFQAIKLKLMTNKSITPLFDTSQFVENIEKLYQIAHHRAVSGQQPENIWIS